MSTVESPNATLASTPEPGDGAFTRARYIRPALLVAAVIICVIVLGATNEAFLTTTNGLAILRAAALTGIVALGATFITVSGRFFSLALGQTAVFCGVSFALLLGWGLPFPLALLATLVIALSIGAVQGSLVAVGANPIVTTLGAGALLAGLAGLATDGKNIRIDSPAVEWIGNARPLGVPTQTWAFIALIVVAWLVMSKTRFGRETVLTGANRSTATSSGISVWRVTITVFVVASIAAGLVGVFGAAQFSQARISEFAGLDFDVVAAVLIGGTAIQGGQGSPLRTALGAVFIATVQNYMLLLGWSSGIRTSVMGLFILIVVVSFHLLRRRTGVK
ncbi:ABC transporter permease [Rhodococcus sp. 15-649-1-2]|nr:ABC transporter permease [Rhodococcus sp. 15-649-1-2]OZE79176.1 ABC transporter permease [Rhodococcus sp. 15-649-1-2]